MICSNKECQTEFDPKHIIKNIVVMSAAELRLIKELWKSIMKKKQLEMEQ
jgi:hypothetical protein